MHFAEKSKIVIKNVNPIKTSTAKYNSDNVMQDINKFIQIQQHIIH